MKRDFSNTTRTALLNILNDRETLFDNDVNINTLFETQDASSADFEVFFDEIETCINASNNIFINEDRKVDELIAEINTVFDSAQSLDVESVSVIDETASTVSSNYLNDLRTMVDAISVAGMGQTPEEILASLDASTDANVFGPPHRFRGSLSSVDDEMFEQAYNELVSYDTYGNVVIDYDRYVELMNTPVDEIKPWEIKAIAEVYYSCLNEDGELNDTRLEMLMNRSYTIDYRTSTRRCAGDVLHCYTYSYELSPVMEMVDCYMNIQATRATMIYGDNDLNSKFNYTYDDVSRYCFVSDVVFLMNQNWSSVTIDAFDRGESRTNPFTISDGDVAGMIIIDPSFGDEASVFCYSSDCTLSVNEARRAETEDDKVDAELRLAANTYMAVVNTLVGMTPWGFFNSAYGHGNTILGLYQSYNQDLYNNQVAQQELDNINMEAVSYLTGGSGSVVQCGDSYYLRNVSLNVDYVIREVALYNAVMGEDAQIDSYTQVQQEFYQYINEGGNLEDYPAINALYEFNSGYNVHGTDAYSAYENDVMDATGEDNFSNVSNYDMEVAANAAALDYANSFEEKVTTE